MSIWKKIFGSNELTTIKVGQRAPSQPSSVPTRQQSPNQPSPVKAQERALPAANAASALGSFPRTFHVPAVAQGRRLYQWLAPQLGGMRRSDFESLLEQRQVLVDGKQRTDAYKLSGGETIVITPAPNNKKPKVNAVEAAHDVKPPTPPAPPIHVSQTPRPTPSGDSYVDRCFDCAWSELDETRIWSNIPELSSVTDLANGGQDAAALAQLAKIWANYRDHDFVYSWKARILARQGHKSDAITILSEGGSKCRKKFGLCKTRAEIEYNAGDLNEAVVWWIRSAVSQISSQGPVLDGPFLYLAYVADAFGDYKSKDKLLMVVERLTQWGRLNDSAVNHINSLVAAKGNRSMSVAIGRLCKEFL